MTKEQKLHQINRSLSALKLIIPSPIPFELLTINCGERWIPLEKYVMFTTWLYKTDIKIQHLTGTDRFKVETRGYPDDAGRAKIYSEYYVQSIGRSRIDGCVLMEHALENTSPIITYGDPPQPDNDAIQLAQDKIDNIRRQWGIWLKEVISEEERDELVALYNRLYNCSVIRKYDGSHMTLPGLDMEGLQREYPHIKELYPEQINATWRIVQDCGAIIDHPVGRGKSLCIVMAAHEMNRMKIRRKPAILCLKANVGDIAKLYRVAYPGAKILAPGEQDFEAKNRKRLFHEIKNNDWDCVIMTHDQFGKIPQSDEIQREILQEEIDNLQKDLAACDRQSRIMLKGLQIRIQTLTAKMKTVMHRIATKKDDDVSFDEMGINHLLIDESHKFKNLTFTTRHDRVAGLGNQEGSQKALNMLFAIRTLQKRFNSDLQATFLSGTVISNSLTELYLLFKYLRPRALEQQKISNFDSWAAVYAIKTTDFEFSVTNQIIAKERFRHFIKVPELALFYNEIADYATNHGIDKPEMEESLVNIPPTPDQQDFIQRLITFATTGNARHVFHAPLEEHEDRARMLICTNYAKKMSTDMRLIVPVRYDGDDYIPYEDHPDNKISVCCKKVSEFYHKFYDDKGTQLIFCDLGIPDKTKWNVYYALREKLVEQYEIPISEIAFIHDYNERSRPTLFKKLNSGEIRILIGSTEKAGTGTNVQQRVMAIHDLDIPWKPAELEQRGGRGARQGNWLAKLKQENKVYRFIYAVEKSLDAYKFTLLKNKQTFITQMKTNELAVRSIDEGSFDESSGMNFAEYIAVLSGDNSLLEKAKVDKRLTVLESLRDAHYREQQSNKNSLTGKRARLEEIQEPLRCLQRDNELFQSVVEKDEATGYKVNKLRIYALDETLAQLEIDRAIEDKEKDALKVSREQKKIAKEIAKQEKQLLKSIGVKFKTASQEKEDEIAEVQEQAPEVEEVKGKVLESRVVIGNFLLQLHKEWRPQPGQYNQLLGEIYGFHVYIKRDAATTDEMNTRFQASIGGMNIMQSNKLYVVHPDGGIEYTYNHGSTSGDSSGVASRNPLNAISRVESILGTYQEQDKELRAAIERLELYTYRPFEKDSEIEQLREESKRMSRAISDQLHGKAFTMHPEKEEVTDEEVDDEDNDMSYTDPDTHCVDCGHTYERCDCTPSELDSAMGLIEKTFMEKQEEKRGSGYINPRPYRNGK